jgi:transposase
MSTVKMQNFIVKGKKIFIGLEDSKLSWKIAVRCDKMLIHETSMPVDYKNLIGYIHNKFPECSIELIYEAGFHGFWLHDLLVKDGVYCVVVPPHTVTEEKTNCVKTDKIDARRLAKNLENSDYKKCHVPDAERREDRQISRTLEDIQIVIVETRNRIWKMLDFHGITAPIKGKNPTEKDILNLRNLKIPSMIALSLKCYIDLLEHLWEQQKTLRNELKNMTKKEKYKETFTIVHSAPGIGWFTAIRLVLEWGENFSRFAGKRQIASFVGLCCSEYSTGETVQRGHLTGLGHRRSRSWIVECAWVAIKKDPVLLDKYKRVMRNTGSSKKAIVAAARKLVGRILYCVKTKQEYVPGLVASGCEIAA